MTKNKLPQLPAPDDPRFGDAVKELMETGEGLRGDPMDQKLTLRDILEVGLVEVKRGFRLGGGQSPGTALRPSTGGGAGQNMTTPPAVVNLQAEGAFTRIILQWDPAGYQNHSLVEIARSSIEDFGQAVSVGSSIGRMYVDVVGGGANQYYWARNISSAGVRGPWSGPVNAQTPRDFDAIRDDATSTVWEPETAYGLFNPVSPTVPLFINDIGVVMVATSAGESGSVEPDWEAEILAFGDTVDDGTVTWQAQEAGSIPFLIDPATGKTVIEGAAIRNASITALQVKNGFFDEITAVKGSLTEANISMANIFNATVENWIGSDNYSQFGEGWRIWRDGTAEFNNAMLRGFLRNTSGDRYIDFREGLPTEGDFVLGDVGAGNYVSFKYEPAFGQKLLRVRGDIALRNYEPGSIPLLNNASTQTESGIPVIESLTSNFSYEDTRLVKSSVVSREGVLSLSWQYQAWEKEVYENGTYKYPFTWYSLWLSKKDGTNTMLWIDDPENPSLNGFGDWFSASMDISVQADDAIELRAHSQSWQPISSTVSARGRNMNITIGFYASETAVK